MYSFPHFEPVCHSMSHSNCCFLTCIQVLQEAGKVVWYSHLFQNFPQFVVIYIVKSFTVFNEADVFLEFSSFVIQWMLAIWPLVPLPSLNPACISGSSKFTYYWSLAWRILSITSLVCEMSATVHVNILWNCLWDWNEKWLFPFSRSLLSFPNLLEYWVPHFHSTVFRIWNSSAGVPSSPLALFAVMLPNAHLNLHSRMSDYRWVITGSSLSESWRSFLYNFSVYSCHLFLISSASVRSIQLLSFIVSIFAGYVPLVS